MVLVASDDLDVCRTIARRVVDVLSLPVEVDGTAHAVRASVGIAAGRWACGDDAVAAADAAMYRAKRSPEAVVIHP